jgi:hypothetical protein
MTSGGLALRRAGLCGLVRGIVASVKRSLTTEYLDLPDRVHG